VAAAGLFTSGNCVLHSQVMDAKQPVIRRGQDKPYVKATRNQIQQRIGAAFVLRACRFQKPRIRRVFQKLFGVEWRQTERYMTRANAEMGKIACRPQ
jgi:hypothetical protein